MRSRLKILTLLGCLALIGCQPQSTLVPMADPVLPDDLAQAYKLSFKTNPDITAHRFLAAFDSFAATGDVTAPRVLDFTRMQDGLERGRLLGFVLALDLNGDAQVTHAEFERFSTFPKGPNKILGLDDLFQFDENQDQIISMREAILYSRTLHMRAATGDLRPIESYLMLFDVNSDGAVTRSEMKSRLFTLLPKPQTPRADTQPALRSASPK